MFPILIGQTTDKTSSRDFPGKPAAATASHPPKADARSSLDTHVG